MEIDNLNLADKGYTHAQVKIKHLPSGEVLSGDKVEINGKEDIAGLKNLINALASGKLDEVTTLNRYTWMNEDTDKTTTEAFDTLTAVSPEILKQSAISVEFSRPTKKK